MPLVRISHVGHKSPDFGAKLSLAVHHALVETFNVPADDYFQIVTEHVPGAGLVGPAEFLGIAHTSELVFIQITCAEGRPTVLKKALYARIADNVSASGYVRREDVVINLVETKRENWSLGNGTASFA